MLLHIELKKNFLILAIILNIRIDKEIKLLEPQKTLIIINVCDFFDLCSCQATRRTTEQIDYLLALLTLNITQALNKFEVHLGGDLHRHEVA